MTEDNENQLKRGEPRLGNQTWRTHTHMLAQGTDNQRGGGQRAARATKAEEQQPDTKTMIATMPTTSMQAQTEAATVHPEVWI
jgi:diacylglycerol kinase family enzyme